MKHNVKSKTSKKRFKTPKTTSFTTNLEVFYKPINGDLESHIGGYTIDLSEHDTKDILTVDIETTGLNRIVDKINSVQLTDSNENTWVIWVNDNKKELKRLVKFLNQFRVVTHNGKFDSLFLYEKTGITLKLYGDTYILAHMLTEPSLSLKYLAKKYFGITYDIDKETKKFSTKQSVTKIKSEFKKWAVDNLGTTKVTQYNKVITDLYKYLDGLLWIPDFNKFVELVNDEELGLEMLYEFYENVSDEQRYHLKIKLIEYGIQDTVYTRRLFKLLRDKIKGYKLSKVYRHELRCYKAFIEVEKVGVTIDNSALSEQMVIVEDTVNKLLDKLNSFDEVKECGITNWNSSQQLVELFVNYLGFESTKTTPKGDPSVDKAQLKQWNDEGLHDILPILLEYRMYRDQLKFLVSWEKLSSDDGKLHPSFNITADTGRTTCNNPNLQQVPQASALRNIITAPKGRKVIECDFSQAELRVASVFAEDENMIEAYRSGSDLHTSTMEFIYAGQTPKDEQQAKAWRTNAKATNFGFLYGMSAKTFVEYAKGYGMKITEEESEAFREQFFDSYPELLTMHDKFIDYAKKYGYTYSPIGRKRFLPNINSRNWQEKGKAERQAVNTPVQGFASDLCISAMADILQDKSLDKSKYSIIGTIHDAILVEVDEDVAEEYAEVIRKHMVSPSVLDICDIEITVPIVADVEIGSAWGKHD